jgi:uncharacterized protein YkwD
MRLAFSLLVAGLFTVGSSVGCSSRTRSVGAKPSWRKAKPKVRASTIVFAPTSDPIHRYNDPPVRPAPSSPLADAMVSEIKKIATTAKITVPVADGRLFSAAAELARVVDERAPLAYKAVEFALHRHGIIEPSPHLIVIWGPIDKPGPIMEQLASRLPSIVTAGRFTRIGVGSAKRPESEAGAVTILALQASHVVTKPVPRALPSGGLIDLDGKVLGAFRNPEVFVTREDGKVEQPPLARTGVTGFRAKVSCKGHKGRQQVEITAVDESGSTVLANFPVWCFARPPKSITITPTRDDTAPAKTAAEAEKRMLELVNRDRKKAGLPPLRIDPRVAKVAKSHSEEMSRTGVVAHVSPTTGSASDRIRVANIKTAAVMENVARAYGVEEAQDGLMNSPGHRANVLSKMATHIGVGIVLGNEVAGRREMFVTQLFIRIPPPIQVGAVTKAVRGKITAASKVAYDAELSQLAQHYAKDIAAGMTPKAAASRVGQFAASLSKRFRSATTVVTTVAAVSGFDPRSVLTDPKVTHYGLGIGQGTHHALGEGAIFIVMVLAVQR